MSGRFQNINFDLDNLPSMPTVAARMLELINDPDTSAEQLARVVSKDQAVSARVLKIANSSFYSMSRKIANLSTAIVILGERTLKNLVLAASMRGIHGQFGKNEQMLWEDSMVCALGSRFLSRKLVLGDPEEAFMAGLFRHIGKVIINNQVAGLSPENHELLIKNASALVGQEQELFGATHAQIGAAVLEQWKLSELMSLVALHHADVEIAGIEDQDVINTIAVVNIASAFPALFGILGEPQAIDLDKLPGTRLLQLESEQLSDLVEEFQLFFTENRDEFLA